MFVFFKHTNYRSCPSCACQSQCCPEAGHTPAALSLPGLRSIPTVDGGQERVRRGLHLKDTPPEEALVVQREERRGRRRAGGSGQTDLEEGKKTRRHVGTMTLNRVNKPDVLSAPHHTQKSVSSNMVVIKDWPPLVGSSRGGYETTDSLHLLVRKL